MSNPGKGGRGKNAPYSTTHCRIPEPLKATVERFSSAYKILIGGDNEGGCKQLINIVDNAISNFDESQNEMEHLKKELARLMHEIEALKIERENAIKNLLPALEMKSREGVKMRAAIASAFPELSTQRTE